MATKVRSAVNDYQSRDSLSIRNKKRKVQKSLSGVLIHHSEDLIGKNKKNFIKLFFF